MLGAERKSMVMKDGGARLTAYHEAGHAVCAIKRRATIRCTR